MLTCVLGFQRFKGKELCFMKKTVSFIISLVMIFSCLTLVGFAGVGDRVPFNNSKYFEYGDYTLHYRTYGDIGSCRERVILLHGFGLSSASLEGIAKEYEKENYFVVTMDVPNFGYSSRETEKTNLLSREELAFALMDNLGGDWIVGGHSMGGGIAVNVALDHPERVKGLVLFAPQTSVEANGATAKLMKSKVFQSLFGAIIGLVKPFPSLVRPLVAISFSDLKFAKEYDLSVIAAPLAIKGTGAGISLMSSHTRGTDLEAFSKLQLPTVIITAENDMVASKSNLQGIIDNAPEGTVVQCVEKGGHMMMEYDPQNTAALTLPVMEKMK